MRRLLVPPTDECDRQPIFAEEPDLGSVCRAHGDEWPCRPALLAQRSRLLARADAADAVIQAARRVRKCVDMQAEDYGLWCAGETATERYMQRELRYLHALVESMPLAHLDSLGGSDFTESL